MAKADYYMVLESFDIGADVYHKGEVVDANDPAFRRSPHLFGPLVVRRHTEARVEQATAAPGEVREGKPITLSSLRGRTT